MASSSAKTTPAADDIGSPGHAHPSPTADTRASPAATPQQLAIHGADVATATSTSSVPTNCRAINSTTLAALEELPRDTRVQHELLINNPEWGVQWTECVELLVEIERKATKGGLASIPRGDYRPDDFNAWIKEARKLEMRPVSSGFGSGMGEWWDDLQPPGRGEDHRGYDLDAIPPTEWRRLRVFNRNGFGLILLGMAWWRTSLGESADWINLLDDMRWVLKVWLDDLRGSPQPAARPSKRNAIAIEEESDEEAVEPPQKRRNTQTRDKRR